MGEANENPTAYISKKWESYYQVLCKEAGVFDQMTNLFTLCAAIGHAKGGSLALTDKKGIFKWTNLSNDNNITVLSAIAWDAKEHDVDVLVNRKEILDVASEYAEGGMVYLNDMYFEDYLENNQLVLPKNLDLEFELAQIIEGLRKEQSIF